MIDQFFTKENIISYFTISVDSHVVKKNKRPIKQMFTKGGGRRPFIGKSDQLLNMESFIEEQLRAQAYLQGLNFPLDERLWIVFHFYFTKDQYFCHDRKGNVIESKINQKLPDLSNLIELPQDCLQKCGIIKNDNLVDSLDLSRRLVGDTTRLDIFILKAENAWNPQAQSKSSNPI